jgi:hypothetical protein
VWSVPADNVEDVKRAAAQHGVRVSEVRADGDQILKMAPAEFALNDSQKSMIERARTRASEATMAIKIVAAPHAPIVEYALTRGTNGPGATSKDPPKIRLALNEQTVLTVVRTSVSVKTDVCVWRGTVEGTGASAMLMWWPGGKIAGTVQHAGRLYSIRHMGGEVHVVVETSDQRMPHDHAPAPRGGRDGPGAHQVPLIDQGKADSPLPSAQDGR